MSSSTQTAGDQTKGDVPSLDWALGMRVYGTSSTPLLGALGRGLDDFVVAEISAEGRKVIPGASFTYSMTPSRWLPYGYYVLVKSGIDTLAAARRVSRKLGIQKRRITFAGLKDANATTSQLIAIENPPATLEEYADESIHLVRVGFHYRRLEIGDNCGNSFEITICSVPRAPSECRTILDAFLSEVERNGGIPAFYGYQRFGTKWPASHRIGQHILRGQLDDAVRVVLSSRKSNLDSAHLADTKTVLSQGSPKAGVYENALLGHLRSHADDYVGALRKVPLRLRRLYVQALQAFIFNSCVSARIAAGLSLNDIADGDLVLYGDRWMRGAKLVAVSADNVDRIKRDVESGKAMLAVELVGFATRTPDGPMREIVDRVLEDEKITRADFRCPALPEARIRGGFRPALMKPRNLVYETALAKGCQELSTVRLWFDLPAGFYATTLLRELMKPPDPVASGF